MTPQYKNLSLQGHMCYSIQLLLMNLYSECLSFEHSQQNQVATNEINSPQFIFTSTSQIVTYKYIKPDFAQNPNIN
jgi:hypothetical protein